MKVVECEGQKVLDALPLAPRASQGREDLLRLVGVGDVNWFPRGKQVASYLGLIPREYSSGGH